jgi:GNAT superfamily N-acetyltransferase
LIEMDIIGRMGAPAEPRLLDAAAGDDVPLLDQLSDLINDVYATAESGLWRDGATRTTPPELADLIRAGEIAVVTAGERIVGSVRLQDLSDRLSEFGMLVAAQDRRGRGVGRALIDFAERTSRERGREAIQLELLLPREWQHPSKEFLKEWYGRRGYEVVRTARVEELYPQLAPLLATPCDFAIYEKALHDAV